MSNPQRNVDKSTGPYVFNLNDPYDRTATIRLVLPALLESREYMRTIRDHLVPEDSIAVWFFGQNGFILKSSDGLLIGIDLYLTDYCVELFPHLPYRLDRQLPVFVAPENLDVDVFVTTHSHEDHADAETIRRMRKNGRTLFVGPFDSMRIYRQCGVPEGCTSLIHPGEVLFLNSTTKLQATFALPTDATDLNHTGTLIEFGNGIRFYNTGDTAWSDRLPALLPRDVDICAVCINGNFHNLAPSEAARIVDAVRPRVVIPCHYDMMVNNVGSPEMLRVALDAIRSDSKFVQMKYYEPWIYARPRVLQQQTEEFTEKEIGG